MAPGPLNTLMEGALAALDLHHDAWPFRRPVDPSEAVGVPRFRAARVWQVALPWSCPSR